MSARTAVRVMPGIFLAVPIVLLAAWYVTLLPPADGYALDATAKATMTLAFVGAFCSACAAWEGARLRRGGVWSSPAVRSRIAVSTWTLAPIVVVGAIAVLAAVLMQLARSGGGLPDIRIITVSVLDIVAYTLAGFALGGSVSIAVALPVALVGPFIWLAFVPAMYPVWLRHVTGLFRDCCGLAQDLDPGALIASTIVDLGLCAAAVIVVTAPLVSRPRLAAGGSLIAALAAALLIVAGMPFAPVVNRDSAALTCRTADGTTICTWPEHAALAAELVHVIPQIRRTWANAGIDSPSTFTEGAPSAGAKSEAHLLIDGTRALTNDRIIAAATEGILPPQPDCPGGATGFVAHEYLAAFYEATAGMTAATLDQQFDFSTDPFPPVLDLVGQLEKAPLGARRSWISRASAVSQQCGDWSAGQLAVGG